MSEVVATLLEQGIIKESQVANMEEFYSFAKEGGAHSFWKTFAKPGLKDFWNNAAKPGLKNLGFGIAAGIPAAGVLAGGTYFAEKADSKARDLNFANSFKTTVNDNPALRENIGQAAIAFKGISSIAPNVAQSPVMLRGLLPQVMNNGLDQKRITEITTLEKNVVIGRTGRLRRSTGGDFVRHFAPGAAAITGTLSDALVRDVRNGMAQSELNKQKKDHSSPGDNTDPSGSGPSGSGPSSTHARTDFAGSAFSGNPTVNTTAADPMTQLYHLFSAAQSLNSLPRELKSGDVSSTAYFRKFENWTDKNPGALISLKKDLVRSYGSQAAYEKAGKERFERKQGSTKTAEFLGEAYASAYLIKEARFDAMSTLRGLAVAAALGGTFGAVEEVADYQRNKKRTLQLKKSWTESQLILKKMPENIRSWEYNKDTERNAKGAFKAMVKVAPDLASNPVIAASFINTALGAHGLIDSAALKSLTDSQKNYKASDNYSSPFASSPFFTSASTGFSGGGGNKLIDSAVKGIAGI